MTTAHTAASLAALFHPLGMNTPQPDALARAAAWLNRNEIGDILAEAPASLSVFDPLYHPRLDGRTDLEAHCAVVAVGHAIAAANRIVELEKLVAEGATIGFAGVPATVRLREYRASLVAPIMAVAA